MTDEGGTEPAERTSAWTWVAAGIAVLFGHVLLTAVGDGSEGSGVLVMLAAALIAVGLVRGAMDWRNRRGR